MSEDLLRIDDIKVMTRIGVSDDERLSEQALLVSVEAWTDIRPVSGSDDIAKGIDYARVIEAVQALGKTERKTIERFAEDAAEAVCALARTKVRITVRKKPPLPGVREASVMIVRP